MIERRAKSEAEMRAVGAELAPMLEAGDVVFLHGPLGAGKTTLVRGLVAHLGVVGPVRSPTFNLLQLFDTSPPVLHADLYRVADAFGIGLEEYLDTHVCLIEWPDRASSLIDMDEAWHVSIEVLPDESRAVRIEAPARPG